MGNFFTSVFKLEERKTNISTEVTAGVTTFMTMAYIIFVNPGILSQTGMPAGALMVSTCLAAAFASLLMAFLANYPVALASGMGLNAFFTFTVCLGMNISWQAALAAVFVEGVIFILLTLTKVREKVVNGIPSSLKYGISAGIGLFIAFIGFQSGQMVVDNPATLVSQAHFKDNLPALLTLAGLVVIGALEAFRIKGAILWGILIITALAIPLGLTQLPSAIVSAPPSISPIFMAMDFSGIGFNFTDPAVVNFWLIVFTFLFVDFFDTVGTLVGVCSRSGLMDENGKLPKAREALLADAIGTVGGAVLGVSTVTSYVESAAGVGVGGRTGLTAVVTALLFLLSIFFSPLISIVPACATAPALIFVGIYMLMGIRHINFDDWTELLPAAAAIFTMPFTYSIASGIEFGMITYAAVKLLSGRIKDISIISWALALVFIVKELFV
ncbi:MAG: NCS2 family permease [Deltaproteobacteria bacterium]|jgi:AGZA family xanthine/uracil permease-like MFS transporter|nr:NCS2 family permease [Deltaproteobacteria bacterium]